MAEVRAGQLPAPGAVDFQAVPLCLQKNDKGGENGTQLASLRQVSHFLQRILPRAKRKPCPENNASEPGGRPAAGRGCAKEKFLYYIVISGLTILHEVGDGDAVQVFVDDFVETLPERESFTASHSGTVGAAGL